MKAHRPIHRCCCRGGSSGSGAAERDKQLRLLRRVDVAAIGIRDAHVWVIFMVVDTAPLAASAGHEEPGHALGSSAAGFLAYATYVFWYASVAVAVPPDLRPHVLWTAL